MASFYINDVEISYVYGSSISIPWRTDNIIHVAWDGFVSSDMPYNVIHFKIDSSDSYSGNPFTFYGNSGVSPCYSIYIDYTGRDSDMTSYAGMYRVPISWWSSEALDIASSVSLAGKSITLTYADSPQNIWNSVTVNFTIPVTRCDAPSSAYLSTSRATESTCTLSWKAGSSGTNNTIEGYRVEKRSYDHNSDTWSAWDQLIDTDVNTRSLTVNTPSVYYDSYAFRICTRGSAGIDWYSGFTLAAAPDGKGYVERVPSFTPPSNFTATQPENDWHINLSWTAAQGSGLSESIEYWIYGNCNNGEDQLIWHGTGNSYSYSPDVYGSWSFTLVTVYGQESDVTHASCNAVSPTITVSVSVEPIYGSTDVTMSWSATATHANDIKYTVGVSDTHLLTNTTTTSYRVTPPSFDVSLQYWVIARCANGTVENSKSVQYTAPSYVAPSNLMLTIHDGYNLTFSWTAGSTGTGTMEYWLKGPDDSTIGSRTSGTSVTYADTSSKYIGKSSQQFTLIYYVNNVAQGTITSTISIGSPSISKPGSLKVNNETDVSASSATFTFTTPTKTNMSGSSFKYELWTNSKIGNEFTNLSVDLSNPSNYTTRTAFKIKAKLTSGGYTATSESDVVYFKYKEPYHTVALYVNGSWVHYIPYVYDNGAWHQCDPYIYDNGWYLCSST